MDSPKHGIAKAHVFTDKGQKSQSPVEDNIPSKIYNDNNRLFQLERLFAIAGCPQAARAAATCRRAFAEGLSSRTPVRGVSRVAPGPRHCCRVIFLALAPKTLLVFLEGGYASPDVGEFYVQPICR